MRWNWIAPTAALVLTASLAMAEARQTLTGEVGDSMCGKKHSMGDESPAECTRECVKGGSAYILIVGDKLYTLKGNKAAIDKFAGAKATVTGTTRGHVLTVSTIKPAK
jgi:hypothetical protein